MDRKPRYVARCLSSDDVAAALRFDRDLTITVRGGGHGVAGTAVCDDGLVIDLGSMKSISIGPGRTATVHAGVLWGELDGATQALVWLSHQQIGSAEPAWTRNSAPIRSRRCARLRSRNAGGGRVSTGNVAASANCEVTLRRLCRSDRRDVL
ncbi:MAG: FAD-binding protein [Chloroflexi bacterium]|nr:FAD-binding protein [Chloroflexota bacterium]